ncbi:hypothetical protein BDW69DRAFT_190264 [Aspergillus filifer]
MQHNSVDLATSIAGELNNLFPGQDENSKRHRKESQERVLERSTNNFSKTQQDLKKIKEAIDSSGTEEDLNQLLQESTPDSSTRVQTNIRALKAKLKLREVEEINEFLIWVVAGFEWFNLQELASALTYLLIFLVPVRRFCLLPGPMTSTVALTRAQFELSRVPIYLPPLFFHILFEIYEEYHCYITELISFFAVCFRLSSLWVWVRHG